MVEHVDYEKPSLQVCVYIFINGHGKMDQNLGERGDLQKRGSTDALERQFCRDIYGSHEIFLYRKRSRKREMFS